MFNVGDRVVVVDYPNNDNTIIGAIGVVYSIEGSFVCVNLDTAPSGYSSGEYFLFQPSELRKVEG